ncbi:MAG TPA: MarR family transcriptional regulator [Bacillales bacterium]|nr:MarR family transcriptional regulator [Bacillales bacterium]
MKADQMTRLVERYGDLSFQVNKMGEVLINNELDDSLTLEQDAVLRYIRENQPCTSSGLSKAFYVEKSAVTAIINRLVNKNFIERERSEEDRRVVYLKLTKQGEQFQMECQERVNRIIEKIISQFDEKEIESFMKTYEKLANLLENHLKEMKGV